MGLFDFRLFLGLNGNVEREMNLDSGGLFACFDYYSQAGGLGQTP